MCLKKITEALKLVKTDTNHLEKVMKKFFNQSVDDEEVKTEKKENKEEKKGEKEEEK